MGWLRRRATGGRGEIAATARPAPASRVAEKAAESGRPPWSPVPAGCRRYGRAPRGRPPRRAPHTTPLRLSTVRGDEMRIVGSGAPTGNPGAWGRATSWCHGHRGHAPARAGCPGTWPRVARFPISAIGISEADDEGDDDATGDVAFDNGEKEGERPRKGASPPASSSPA